MLRSPEIVKKEIESGKTLLLAGEEEVLKTLPRGNWIAGTIPYFMDRAGGIVSSDKIDVTELPHPAALQFIRWYGETELAQIADNTPDPGFTFLILPATSKAHLEYAQNAPNYPGIFLKPVIGWIAGVLLADLGKKTPKAVNGKTGEFSDAKGIAMHCSLPAGKTASIGIINMFKPGAGDAITFDTEGFSVGECLVNGKKTNLAEYLVAQKIDTQLPLVADYSGTMVNVSFQSVDEQAQRVALYAPVFRGVTYKIAAPVADYVTAFTAYLKSEKLTPVFSCNCILNFLYSKLEGKQTGNFTGPITFGEIAYQLLNQTLVYLEFK
jgi:hypothetical protein